MSSAQPTSDISTTTTIPTAPLSSEVGPSSSTPTGDRASAVHLNNLYVLTFVVLALVFIITCCTMVVRRRDRRRLFTEAMSEGFIRGPRVLGPMPKLHDLQVSWGKPGWKDIMPITADALEASARATTRPARPNKSPTNTTRNTGSNGPQGDTAAETRAASASRVMITMGLHHVKIDVLQVAVLIAMPDPNSAVCQHNGRRNRGRLKHAPAEGSQRSSEDGSMDTLHKGNGDDDELPLWMIGVARVTPGDGVDSKSTSATES